MTSFERPRGTRDFGPDEMARRRALIDRMREVFERYGYREVSTPTFEHLELFTAKSGEEIVQQLYAFEDKSERELTLRPELTAPVIRFYNNELRAEPKPLRVFYHGNCFRYERPQSGRYREFWQFGCELVGAPGPGGDAEVIAVANDCIEAAGAETVLRVGHIGILQRLVGALPTDEEAQGEVYRLIDKDAEELGEKLAGTGAPRELTRAIEQLAFESDLALDLTLEPGEVRERFRGRLAELDGFVGEPPFASDDLDDAGLGKEERASLSEAFEELEETLVRLGEHGLGEVRLDLGVARGLDYYTGVVFEIEAPELGAESQVAGGGRYTLAETLGGQPTATTGFGLGFDRVLLAADVEADTAPADVHVIPIGDDARRPASELAHDLREASVRTSIDLRDRSISKNLDYANRLGIPRAILLGSNELEQGVATVKHMASGNQSEVDLDELADHLTSQE